MDASAIIATARRGARLTQRQLASRAGTSAAAICLYESGAQVPRFDTLVRIVEAAEFRLVCDVQRDDKPGLDLDRNARVLLDVLDLAEHLPHRLSGELDFPPFASLARSA